MLLSTVNGSSETRYNCRVLSHIGLFSTSVAFLIVCTVFLFTPALRIMFIHIEVRLNEVLGIRQTDLIRGYFEFAIPTLALALVIFSVFLLSRSQKTTQTLLKSVAPFILLVAPLVYWVIYYEMVGWPFRWPYRFAPVELAVALCLLVLFLRGRPWSTPSWAIFLLFAIHFTFWYWTPSTNPARADYSGPIAPILGFSSALAWLAYLHSDAVQTVS